MKRINLFNHIVIASATMAEDFVFNGIQGTSVSISDHHSSHEPDKSWGSLHYNLSYKIEPINDEENIADGKHFDQPTTRKLRGLMNTAGKITRHRMVNNDATRRSQGLNYFVPTNPEQISRYKNNMKGKEQAKISNADPLSKKKHSKESAEDMNIKFESLNGWFPYTSTLNESPRPIESLSEKHQSKEEDTLSLEPTKSATTIVMLQSLTPTQSVVSLSPIQSTTISPTVVTDFPTIYEDSTFLPTLVPTAQPTTSDHTSDSSPSIQAAISTAPTSYTDELSTTISTASILNTNDAIGHDNEEISTSSTTIQAFTTSAWATSTAQVTVISTIAPENISSSTPTALDSVKDTNSSSWATEKTSSSTMAILENTTTDNDTLNSVSNTDNTSKSTLTPQGSSPEVGASNISWATNDTYTPTYYPTIVTNIPTEFEITSGLSMNDTSTPTYSPTLLTEVPSDIRHVAASISPSLIESPTTKIVSSVCTQNLCKHQLSADLLMQYQLHVPEDTNIETCEGCQVNIKLTYSGEAWLGFAFSTDGQMVGSEAVIGNPFVSETKPEKYYLGGKYDAVIQPMEDTKQTLVDSNIEIVDGRTIMTFTKYLKEDSEIKILTGNNTFLWAHGDGAFPTYHGSNKNSFHLNLLENTSS